MKPSLALGAVVVGTVGLRLIPVPDPQPEGVEINLSQAKKCFLKTLAIFKLLHHASIERKPLQGLCFYQIHKNFQGFLEAW